MSAPFQEARVKPEDIAQLTSALQRVLTTLAEQPSSPVADPVSDDRLTQARAQIDQHRLRRDAFGRHADLFNNPRWLMLLELYVAHETGDIIAKSSLVVVSGAKLTTGIRAIDMLTSRGLITQAEDTHDRRCVNVALTLTGVQMMERHLDSTRHRAGTARV